MRKKLGLSGKLVLMILFSALASAVFLVGMQVVLNKALWLYFAQPETQQRAVEKQVQERVKKQIDKNQKDYYLREHMKAIQTEKRTMHIYSRQVQRHLPDFLPD